jgi:hypothetical protein
VTATTVPTEVTRYLEAVRALLVDLPADEREELLDDLSVHLQEVRAETDEPLERILGTPAAFAAELLASSGHASDPDATRQARLPGLDAARGGWSRLQTSPAYHWVRDLRPELVPGWWVLRGYLGAVLVVELVSRSAGSFPVPRVGGSSLLGLAVVVGAIVASVRLGRHSTGRRSPLWVWVLDTVVLLGAFSFLASLGSASEYVYVEDAHQAEPGVLTHPDGTPITNLFPYDDQGRLLDDVLLYDQDGAPVLVDGNVRDYPGEPTDLYTDDGLSLDIDYPLDANGAPVLNAYPLDQLVEQWRSGPDGSQQAVDAPVRPPAIAVPRLSPDETVSTTTSSTTTTTTAPGG